MIDLNWRGKRIAVLSPNTLGDTTIFFWMARRLQEAGAEVVLFANSFVSLQNYMPGIRVVGGEAPDILRFSAENDLVFCYYAWLLFAEGAGQQIRNLPNLVYLAGKSLPKDLLERRVKLGDQEFLGSRVICLDTKAGKTMVDWIEHYATHVLGVDCSTSIKGFQGLPTKQPDQRVAIFPTSPHASKNYWHRGFRTLAKRLHHKGWTVDFIATPAESERLSEQFAPYRVQSFADMQALIEYLLGCAAVVSNDSGGGHLASLLGLRTFTITRRKPRFTWRPGFNSANCVVSPVFTFKLLGRIIWRPFIPIGRVVEELSP